jgi:hypothetical protein
MRLFLIIIIGFVFLSTTVCADDSTVHVDDSNVWVEFSVGGGGDLVGASVNFKYGDEHSNWALEIGQYDEFSVFSSTEDRENAASTDVEVTTIGLTKNWNNIGKWGYSEIGIGIGVADGTWSSNCLPVNNNSSLSSRDVCDITDGVKFGIPVHASAVFGKYFGIGITAKAFVTSEDAHLGLMVTLPFGDFTN